MKGRPRIFSDAERLERKRARARKENLTLEQIARHNERGRKENLTTEQLERKSARERVINLTPKQLENKRNRNRVSSMNDVQIENKRKKSRSIMRQKRKIDPVFKITGHISRIVTFMLKSNGSPKNRRSVRKYLSWNKLELQNHIIAQFEPWMTWDNYGKYDPKTWDDNDQSTWKWQLDHIIPRSDLQYSSMEDDNFKKCWALSNFRPLSAKQNILDGTSRIRHLNKGKK